MEVCNFSYKFKKNEKLIFDKLNLKFSLNKLNIILGNNGTGKSILLDFIANVDNIRDNKHFKNFPKKTNIAYQMQGVPFIGNISVKKTIKLFIETDGNNIKTFKIPTYIKNMYGKQMGDLSGGQKRLIIVYGISILNRDLYLFDEPYSGLDEHTKEKVNLVIRDLIKRDKTVIMTTHDLSYISNSDKITILNNKKCIFNGYQKDLINNNNFKNLKEAYDFLT